MVGNISSRDVTFNGAQNEKNSGDVGVALPCLDDAIEDAIESVMKGKKKAIILWGDRFAGKTLAISRYNKMHGALPVEHIQMPQEPFNEADAQRFMNELKNRIVLEGSYYQICYLLNGGSLANESDKTKKWLERLEDGINEKLGVGKDKHYLLPDDFKGVWVSFSREEAVTLFNHYADKVEREHPGVLKYSRKELGNNQESYLSLASLGDPWEENESQRGRFIPSLLEIKMMEHAGKNRKDLEKQVKKQTKDEQLVASFFGFTALDATLQGMNILGVVKDVAGLLAVSASFLPLAGIAILGTSSLLGFVKAGKTNGFSKYVSIHKSWINLPKEKRIIICENLDEKNELSPGSSYAFLNQWLCGKGSGEEDVEAFKLRLEQTFRTEFVATVQIAIDENKELKSKLEELNEKIERRIENLESEIHAIKTELSFHDDKFIDLYKKFRNQEKEIEILKKMVQSLQGIKDGVLSDADYSNYFGQGNALNRQSKYEAAIQEYNHAINLNPDDPDYHHNKGAVLIELSKYEAAIEEFDQAIRLKPDDPIYHFNKGAMLGGLSKYEAAIEEFDLAIRLKPDDPEYYYGKGMSLTLLSKYEAAIEEFDQAIRLKPDDPEYHYGRGVASFKISKYEAAIEEFDQAIRLKPDDSQYYYYKGAVLIELSKYEAAIEEFDQAIRLKPDDPEYHHYKGSALVRLSRYEEAIQEYNHAINLNPDDSTYHNKKGIALIELSKYEAAIEELDHAISLEPDEPVYYYNKGIALVRLSKYEAAIEEFDQAIRLKPDDFDYRFAKNYIQLKMNARRNRWRKYFKKKKC